MEIIRGVPQIDVICEENILKTIKTIQTFKEYEDRVILTCAEEVPEFFRGFICDMKCYFQVYNSNSNSENIGKRIELIKDLLLAYINKDMSYDSFPEFEYVFFK